jgi:UDP-glucuronate decarboxylase
LLFDYHWRHGAEIRVARIFNSYADGRVVSKLHHASAAASEPSQPPLPEDDPRQHQPAITLAKPTLSWEPRVPLREGLPPTVAYFEDLGLKLGLA